MKCLSNSCVSKTEVNKMPKSLISQVTSLEIHPWRIFMMFWLLKTFLPSVSRMNSRCSGLWNAKQSRTKVSGKYLYSCLKHEICMRQVKPSYDPELWFSISMPMNLLSTRLLII